MRNALFVVSIAVIGVTVIALSFTFFQAQQDRLVLSADLEYRTRLLADSLRESVEPAFQAGSAARLESLVKTFSGRERLLSFRIYDVSGNPLAGNEEEELEGENLNLVARAIASNDAVGEFRNTGGVAQYVLAKPLLKDDVPSGAFIVVQDAGYIDVSVASRWQSNLYGVLLFLLLFAAALAAIVRFALFRPLWSLTESVRDARSGKSKPDATSLSFLFKPLVYEIGELTHSLSQARRAASDEARMRLEKIDSPWTAERLQEFIKAHIKNRSIYVISHAEPFTHAKSGREVRVSIPAGGVVTAVSSMMEACGGLWIAHGGGDADRETVDTHDKIRVPPEEPTYTLKRIFLSPEELAGYYRGFSNEALWPLSHIAYTRPIFRKEDWTMYKTVNGKFAQSVLEEIRNVERPLILIQDYHLALLPHMIKSARPDAQVALFWHIPWPSAEAFSICPWRKQLLKGMLGADLVGFHTQLFCNNFIETVAKEIESLIDYERFSITHEEHTSFIKPFPISIAFSKDGDTEDTLDRSILETLGIHTEQLIVGIDRLDYTKGILERLRGIEYLFDVYPNLCGKVTFLQIGSPTRIGVEKYNEYAQSVEKEVARINGRFAKNGWKPVVFEHKQYSRNDLNKLYRAADVCLVTSLHDGMNLVAKEFVAARDDEAGTLVLSQFTGAARDLKGALIVNPYSAEETADALHLGLTMPASEQHRRMKTMRQSVKEYNVYRWTAEFIRALSNIN